MRKLLNHFRRDVSGTVALLAGLSAIPMCLVAGVGIDMERINEQRATLQTAIDGAALALGASDLSDLSGLSGAQVTARMSQLTAMARTWVGSNYAPHFYHDSSINLNVLVNADGSINVQASHDFPTTMMRIGGINSVQLAAHTQVMKSISQTRMEIALVLDNTGSMAGNKISQLKTAASNFVDTLQAAAQKSSLTNPLKLSLVPYTMTVNVGAQYKTASWITGVMPSAYGADIFTTANTNRFTLLSQMGSGGVAWGGCVESRPYPYDTLDTGPSVGTPASLYVPFFSPDEPDTGSGYVNNYLADASTDSSKSSQIKQGNPAKYKVKPKAGSNGVGYTYGPNAGCIAQPLIRLTTDFTSVKTGINGMVAGGDTNISAGVLWGWHTLSPNGPFADGVAYNDAGNTNKIMVLMTDGENHNVVTSSTDASAYGGLGYIWQNRLGITSGTLDQRRDALDARLLKVCENAKSAGIIIYTIALEVAADAPDAHQMMRQCATSLDKFYDVANASDLDTTFKSIGRSIRKLYLSR